MLDGLLVSIRSRCSTPPLFTTLRSPTICGLRASTTHFKDPHQKRDAANQPQSAFCWGQIKNQRPKNTVLLRFRLTPTRSGPGATIMLSVGVLSPPAFLRCFRRTPTRSGPGATIMHSVGCPFAHLASGIQLRTANLMGPLRGPPRCRAPSALGPGAFFPAFRWRVGRFFAHRIKKDPTIST